MAKAICQYALDRVMLYLQDYGIEPSPQVCRRALALIDECLAETGDCSPGTSADGAPILPGGVMEKVMDRIPAVFELPALRVPLQRPTIRRGSIGYGARY